MNEPYRVVARRFRPTSFDQVVGQDAVLESIRSALSAKRIPHAFLFSGSRGVGKTTNARILARALNCVSGPTPEPCGTCEPCRATLDGRNPDVVEIDAASHNLVDDIRELRERVGFASMGSRFKVYILDEVHMLTRSAFNAFLKTLEEPPPGVVFILATTELHKVPDTIRSRCQVLMFRQIAEDEIAGRLTSIAEAEGVELDVAVVREIAVGCRGAMRDAETALERILPVARERGGPFDLAAYRALVHRVGFDASVEVVAAMIAGSGAPALHFAARAAEAGVDEREALGDVVEVLRVLLLLKVDGPESPLVPHRDAARARLLELAERATVEQLDAMIQAGLVGRERIRRLDDRRLVLEVSLLRMASAGQLPQLGELVAAVRGGALPTMAAPTPIAGMPDGAAAAPVAATAGADLSAVLIERLRGVKPMLVATIEECSVVGPDADGVVRIAPRTDRRMHRDRLASAPVRELIAGQLADVIGRPVRVVVEAAGTEASEPPRDAASPRAEPGPAVRRVADRFDGQIVDADGESEP